jgi:hypothetical protein
MYEESRASRTTPIAHVANDLIARCSKAGLLKAASSGTAAAGRLPSTIQAHMFGLICTVAGDRREIYGKNHFC